MEANFRWKALDAMKALCVLAMVIFHSIFWLLTSDDQIFISEEILMFQSLDSSFMILLSFVAIFGLLPPMIPMTAGTALRFHLRKRWSKNSNKLNKKYPLSTLLKRTLFLVILGIFLNLLAWGFDDIFSWDVLFFISFSFVLITLFSKIFSIYLLIFISFAGVFITPFIRKLFLNFDEFYIGIILVGDLIGDHYWPIFPWIFLVIFGLCVAHFYLILNRKTFYKLFLISGLILMGAAIFSGNFFFEMESSNLWGKTIFQPPTTTLLGIMGLFNILIVIFDKVLTKIKLKKYGLINSFSKGILWVYILHTIIFYRISEVVVSSGEIPTKIFITSFLFIGLIFSYFVGIFSIYLTSKIKLKNKQL